MISLKPRHDDNLISSAADKILSLMCTNKIEVGDLYYKWIKSSDLEDNPFSLSLFVQSLWELSGEPVETTIKFININTTKKRPSWSKFYIKELDVHFVSVLLDNNPDAIRWWSRRKAQ